VEDFALFRHRMLDPAAMGWKYRAELIRKNRETVDRLLATVRERGPVRSADFERRDGKGGGWWEWKPEKRMLESLFTAGELMIARRDNFQRVYDVPRARAPVVERRPAPLARAVARELALKAGARARRGEGEVGRRLLPHLEARHPAHPRAPGGRGRPAARAGGGVEGAGFVHPDHHDLALRAAAGEIRPTLTTLLSPFDPLVWDRARAAELFGFDYRLECYTPAPKRRWGYFVLPICAAARSWAGSTQRPTAATASSRSGRSTWSRACAPPTASWPTWPARCGSARPGTAPPRSPSASPTRRSWRRD
jgi:uncharacterized protein YcaQ